MADQGGAGSGWAERDEAGKDEAGDHAAGKAGAGKAGAGKDGAGKDGRVWDRAGVMRAVRRRADLSQREVATQVQVAPSTIANTELADKSVSLQVMEKVLAAYGMRLAVIDADGQEVTPEPADVARDNGDRRFPAHLDAEASPSVAPPTGRGRRPCRVRYQHRAARDRRRQEVCFVPVRHPDREEVAWFSLPASARQQRVRGFLAGARMSGMLPRSISGPLREYVRGPGRPSWFGQLCAVRRPVPYWVGDLRELAGALRPHASTSAQSGVGAATDDDQSLSADMPPQDPRSPEELRDERLERVMADIDTFLAIAAMDLPESLELPEPLDEIRQTDEQKDEPE